MSTQTHRLTITELPSSDDIAVLRVSGELDATCEEFFSVHPNRPACPGAAG
ncbi:hypothetical protein [Streptomyces phaeochromogenes]|uniref:hypothetical protein n=1 Tax=Streptomyces phaeochromogenes TaxID=1923 RepID=UPI002DDAC817|nr:hypothetical protein [Streptomyces phaeochromogenes]WRZ35856.1 hypothetical protein OG931_53140 [Streptomyces phaeochromogenes]